MTEKVKKWIGWFVGAISLFGTLLGIYLYYWPSDHKQAQNVATIDDIQVIENDNVANPIVNQSTSISEKMLESEIGRVIKAFGKRKNVPVSSKICFDAGVSLAIGKQALEKQKKDELLKAIDKFKCSVEACPTPEGYILLGKCYYTLGQYNNALKSSEKSYDLYKKEEDRAGEGTILNNIAVVYYNWTKYDKALEYYEKSLKIQTEIGDRSGEGTILNNIGVVYYDWGKYDKALEYYEKSLKILEEIGAAPIAKTVRKNIKTIKDKYL